MYKTCNKRKVFKFFFLLLFSFIIAHCWFSANTYVENRLMKTAADTDIKNQSTNYKLYIIVLVYDRYWSLIRLLDSVNSALFYSDRVKLQVWIDRSANGSYCPITYQTAKNFTFRFGDYEVKVHPRHVGLFGQWLTTWVPEPESKDIAVILEDDLTVSKYFYKYIKLVHEKYDNVSEINGYSLQGGMKRLSVGKRKRLTAPHTSNVFLYPSMGPWGFSPKNRNWRKFLDWFNSPEGHEKTQPFIPEHVAWFWYNSFRKKGKADTMWTIWHRYYAWKNNEYTMFCNFRGFAGLANNYMEPGLHVGGSRKKSNPLLTHWDSQYEHLPVPEEVPRLDLKGNLIS